MTPKTVERALFILQTLVLTLPMQGANAVLRRVSRRVYRIQWFRSQSACN
jgi:hypothetical protein